MGCRLLLACCCLTFLLFGCKKNNDPDIIVNIDDDFYVDLFEDISNGERRFELNLTSIKEQDCLNYSIDYSLNISNIIELAINDLVQPELCVEGNAQAKVNVPFGTIEDGNYVIYLNLKDAIKNTGRLMVTPTYYQLNMDSDDGIELTHDQLFRLPPQTLWGTVAYNNSNQSQNAESFIADLEEIVILKSIAQDGLYPSGYYGYFDLDEEKSITLIEKPDADHHKPFIFSYDGQDLSDVEALLETTCNQHSGLDIQIRLANGQILTCD